MGLYKSAYLTDDGAAEFWVDSQNNRWDSRIFTYEQALENSKHLLFHAIKWDCINYIKDGVKIEMPEPNPENGVKEYKRGNKIYRDKYVNGKLESRVYCYEGDRKTWYERNSVNFRIYKEKYKKLVLEYERIGLEDKTIVREFKKGRLFKEGEYYNDTWLKDGEYNDVDEKVIVRFFDEKGKVEKRFERDRLEGVVKKFDGKGALSIERKYKDGVLEIKEFEKGKLVIERKGKYEFSGANREKILLKEFDGDGKLVREYDIDEYKGSTKIYEKGKLVGKRSRHDGVGALIAWELVSKTRHYSTV